MFAVLIKGKGNEVRYINISSLLTAPRNARSAMLRIRLRAPFRCTKL